MSSDSVEHPLDDVTRLRDLSNVLLDEGSEKLLQIQEETSRVHEQIFSVADQIESTFDAIVSQAEEIVSTAKERKNFLSAELQLEGAAHISKLAAVFKSVSSDLTRLRDFQRIPGDKLDEANQRTWKEITAKKLMSTPVEQNKIYFVPEREAAMPLNGEPILGRIYVTSQSDKENSDALPPVDYYSSKVTTQILGASDEDEKLFQQPTYVTVTPDEQNIIVMNSRSCKIQILDMNGRIIKEFGEKGEHEGQVSVFNSGGGLALTKDGNIIVADTENHRLQVLDTQGKVLRVIGQEGTDPGEFKFPNSVAVDADDRIYICDNINHRIQVLEGDGKIVRTFQTKDNADDWRPFDIALCSNGDIVVVDERGKLEIFSNDGDHRVTLCSTHLAHPAGITIDREDNILVTDFNDRVFVLRSSGEKIRSFGSTGKAPGRLSDPHGVCCMKDGRVLVVDRSNDRLQFFKFG